MSIMSVRHSRNGSAGRCPVDDLLEKYDVDADNYKHVPAEKKATRKSGGKIIRGFNTRALDRALGG